MSSLCHGMVITHNKEVCNILLCIALPLWSYHSPFCLHFPPLPCLLKVTKCFSSGTKLAMVTGRSAIYVYQCDEIHHVQQNSTVDLLPQFPQHRCSKKPCPWNLRPLDCHLFSVKNIHMPQNKPNVYFLAFKIFTTLTQLTQCCFMARLKYLCFIKNYGSTRILLQPFY